MVPGSKPEEIVPLEEARRFIIDCFLAINVPEKNAIFVADSLLAADCNGYYSHGISRLPLFLEALSKKSVNGFSVPEIVKQTPSTALVDGRNGLGPVVASFCMDLAIKKAKQVGIGWVCCKHSNNCGMMGAYSLRAIKAGLIGISMANSIPAVAPTNSMERMLGTNPIAVGVPAGKDTFFLDMATSSAPLGRIEVFKTNKKSLPVGWAIDKTGKATTDPNEVIQGGSLLPIGGFDYTGYKGYSLVALIDILAGVLSGAGYSKGVRSIRNSTLPANVGQAFIAIDPNCFAPCFEERAFDYNKHLRNMEPIDPKNPVIVPGDRKKKHVQNVEENRGITYSVDQLKILNDVSKTLRVKSIQTRHSAEK